MTRRIVRTTRTVEVNNGNELDFSLSNRPERNRLASNSASSDRAWSWVFWGILVLILEFALVVVLVLILTSFVPIFSQ